MPINLKEIFVDDDNNEKVEKINYNFDQIIGTGGQIGPRGAQGVEGLQGPLGPQGAQGAPGIQGEAGQQGENGIDSWYNMDHAPVTGENDDYNCKIIKPKLFGESQPTSVYIGDPTFSDNPVSEGDTLARASLVVAKQDPFENNIRIVSTNPAHNMVIRGDIDAQGSIFHIQKGDVSDSNNIKLEVSFNNIDINATSLDNEEGLITLSSRKTTVVSPELGFNTEIGTKSYFNDRVHIVNADLLVQGSGFTRVSRGTSDDRDNISSGDLSGGNVRYNSTTKNYEAYYENTADGNKWLNLRQITDADGDTYIDLPLTNDNDRILIFSAGDQYMRIGGSQLSLKSSSAAASTAVPTILINKTVFARENVHFIDDGKGVSFKEGPAATNPNSTSSTAGSAVNYDTNISTRTMHDFFYREVGGFEMEGSTIATAEDIRGQGNTTFPGFTDQDDEAVLTDTLFLYFAGNETPNEDSFQGRVLTLLNTGDSELFYQKIGNLVHLDVKLSFKPFYDLNGSINGANYPASYPGTWWDETKGGTYGVAYWQGPAQGADETTQIGTKNIVFNIPEIFKRLPSKKKVISEVRHRGVNLDLLNTSPHPTVALSGGAFGYMNLEKYSIIGTDTGRYYTHNDIVNGWDETSWIELEFSLTYPCEDSTTWQANYSFNDAVTDAPGPGGGSNNIIRD